VGVLTSLRALLDIMTEGLTGGGGTGSTLSTNQSGRAYLGLNPSSWQSSSLMRFSMPCTWGVSQQKQVRYWGCCELTEASGCFKQGTIRAATRTDAQN
jgi:hypothetical protein